jgi:hypothetical protein
VDPCAGSFLRPPSSSCVAVVVVPPAERGERDDSAGGPDRDAFTWDRNPLTNPLVRSSRVEVAQRGPGPSPKGVALRNCCAVHCRVGARVTATWTTRLLFTSTTKNAKTGRNQMS